MSNSAAKQVLVLAAHPDDETLGCGATMAKLSSSGHHIHLLTFTDGYAARGQALEGKNRNDALEKVSAILGIKRFAFGNFPDNQMDTVPLLQVCKFIESQVQFTPDIIFTHHPACLNVDHGIVFRAMITAFRPQLGDAVDILAFSVPSSTEWNPLSQFQGNTYFDVKDYVSRKMEALKTCYGEELRPYPHARSYESILNRMKVNGSEVGLEYAETFQSIRRIIL